MMALSRRKIKRNSVPHSHLYKHYNMGIKYLNVDALMKIIELKGDEQIGVVVPTANSNGHLFNNFIKNVKAQKNLIPTVIAVESSGTDFNFSKSVNTGIAYLLNNFKKLEYICITNDDVILPFNFISEMIEGLKGDELIGYITPLFQRGSEIVNNFIEMPSYSSIIGFTKFYNVLYMLKRITFPLVIMGIRIINKLKKDSTKQNINGMINCQPICFLKRNTIEDIGLFDEKFNNGCEDLDYAIRTYLLGYEVLIHKNVVVQDIGSATVGKGGFNALYINKNNDNGYRSAKNWEYLAKKFGRKRYKLFLRLSKNKNVYFPYNYS